MTVDVTKNCKAYTHYLVEAMPKIREMFYDRSITYNEMYNYVRSCVLKGDDLPARKRFLEDYLPSCATKAKIEQLCYNSVKKAKNHIVSD